jgi:uncharacterized integral membrane protein
MLNVLVSSIVALWVSAIALLSVQNATLVELRFLTGKTVPIPMGVLLGFGASAGMLGTALVLPGDRPSARSRDESDPFEDE